MFEPNSRAYNDARSQFALLLDVGKPLYEICTAIEGDGPLVFVAFDMLEGVDRALNSNPFRICSNLGVTSKVVPLLKEARDYWKATYTKLKPKTDILKAARILSPSYVAESKPTVERAKRQIKCLRIWMPKDFSDQELESELKSYLEEVGLVDDKKELDDIASFWRANAHETPVLARLYQRLLLVQPSSATAERVFSLFTSSFNNRQDSALVDVIEASLMLQFNRSKRD